MENFDPIFKLPYEEYMEARTKKLRKRMAVNPTLRLLLSYENAWEFTKLLWSSQWIRHFLETKVDRCNS